MHVFLLLRFRIYWKLRTLEVLKNSVLLKCASKHNSHFWTYDLCGPIPYVMLLIQASPLRGQMGGDWAMEIETFLGPLNWHRAVRRVSFGAQKVEISRV
jgi:hypothetical protein